MQKRLINRALPRLCGLPALALLLAGVLACLVASLPAQADSARSDPARSDPARSDPNLAGEVHITYFGHGAFLFTAPSGRSVLFDGWQGRQAADGTRLLTAFPEIEATARFSTQVAPRSWVEGDVRVTGIAAGAGSLYQVQTGGLTILVWGTADPAAIVTTDAMTRPDILVAPANPAGGGPAGLAALADRLRPALLIPARYHIDGLSDPAAGLVQIDQWVYDQPYRTALWKSQLTATPEWMEGFDRHIQFFGRHYRSE